MQKGDVSLSKEDSLIKQEKSFQAVQNNFWNQKLIRHIPYTSLAIQSDSLLLLLMRKTLEKCIAEWLRGLTALWEDIGVDIIPSKMQDCSKFPERTSVGGKHILAHSLKVLKAWLDETLSNVQSRGLMPDPTAALWNMQVLFILKLAMVTAAVISTARRNSGHLAWEWIPSSPLCAGRSSPCPEDRNTRGKHHSWCIGFHFWQVLLEDQSRTHPLSKAQGNCFY